MKSTIFLFLCSILTFLSPIQGIILLLITATLLDSAFMIFYVLLKKGRKEYKSTKLFNLAVKLLIYIGATVTLFLADKFVFEGSLFNIKYLLSKSISMVFLYIELLSIDETSQRFGNKPFLDYVKGFVSSAKRMKKDLNEIK
jgi:hypothetical protein